MVSPHSSRIDDIEILRALAVLLTIFGHIGYVLPWGNETFKKLDLYFGFWGGVDLFFAISGFVIARDLLKRFETSDSVHDFWKTTFAFWIRRVFRIWPTAWFWAAILVIGAALFKETGYWGPVRSALADFSAVVMQVANFHIWDCIGNGNTQGCGSATVWWSLSLEEQFYILLPLAFLAFRKRLAVLLGLVVIAQLFVPRPMWSFLWAVRTDAIALGVLLAIFSRSSIYEMANPSFLSKRRFALPVLGLLLFLLVQLPSNWQGKINPVPFSTGMVALVSIVLVFIASHNRDYLARAVIFKPLFLWVGSRSYALYLVHSVAATLTFTIWWYLTPRGTTFDSTYTTRFLVTWFVLTIVLSELNFRLIETPLRRRGKAVASRLEDSNVGNTGRQ